MDDPLAKPTTWKEYENKILYSHYHVHYGHCITVDISSLSNDNGLFPMSFGFERMALKLTAGVEGSITNKIFLHDGTNIGQLGENIEGTEYFISSAPTVILFLFFSTNTFPKEFRKIFH